MTNVYNLRRPSFWQRAFALDSMANFLAGIGVPDRDKAAMSLFTLNVLDADQLEKAYRSDWLARKIVDIPAFDATRAWRSWKAEAPQIEKLEEAERSFDVQTKVMKALTTARLYGGSCLVLGVKNQKFEEPLDVEKVGKGDLIFVHVADKWTVVAGPLVRDITSPWFGEPSYYQRTAVSEPGPQTLGNQAITPEQVGIGLTIHPSRVVRLVGLEYPSMDRAPDQWGDSALQPVVDAIKNAGLVSASIASLTSRATVDVIKVPGLTNTLSTDAGTRKLVERFAAANAAKSVVNSLLIDKEEEWTQLTAQFSGLPQVLQMYLTIASGAADIPATRLIGREPAGMSATGDSDIRNYYDRISSDQNTRLKPLLSRLDEVLIRHVLGKRDPAIHYEWSPLWQMDESQDADIALRKAQAFKIDVECGLVPAEALKKGRENQLVEDGTYPGLEGALEEAAEAAENVPEGMMPMPMMGPPPQGLLPPPGGGQGGPPGQPPPGGEGGSPPPPGGGGGGSQKAADWDPNQPRDPDGTWASGGGSAAAEQASSETMGPDEDATGSSDVTFGEYVPLEDPSVADMRDQLAEDRDLSGNSEGGAAEKASEIRRFMHADEKMGDAVSDAAPLPSPAPPRLATPSLAMPRPALPRPAPPRSMYLAKDAPDVHLGEPDAAGMLFVTPDGRALFVRRAGEGDPHAGQWSIPAGTVEVDETGAEAASREAAEEVGWPGDWQLTEVDRRGTEGVDFATFLQPVPAPFEPTLNHEHDFYMWAPLEDPPKNLHPGLAATLDETEIGKVEVAPPAKGRGSEAQPDLFDFNPDQPRDPDGRWAGGAGGGEPEQGPGVRAAEARAAQIRAYVTTRANARTIAMQKLAEAKAEREAAKKAATEVEHARPRETIYGVEKVKGGYVVMHEGWLRAASKTFKTRQEAAAEKDRLSTTRMNMIQQLEQVEAVEKAGKIKDYNPYHEPAGSPEGGRFASAPGGEGGGGETEVSHARPAKSPVLPWKVKTVGNLKGFEVLPGKVLEEPEAQELWSKLKNAGSEEMAKNPFFLGGFMGHRTPANNSPEEAKWAEWQQANRVPGTFEESDETMPKPVMNEGYYGLAPKSLAEELDAAKAALASGEAKLKAAPKFSQTMLTGEEVKWVTEAHGQPNTPEGLGEVWKKLHGEPEATVAKVVAQQPKQAFGALPPTSGNIEMAYEQFKPYAKMGDLIAFTKDYPASANLLAGIHGSLLVAEKYVKMGGPEKEQNQQAEALKNFAATEKAKAPLKGLTEASAVQKFEEQQAKAKASPFAKKPAGQLKHFHASETLDQHQTAAKYWIMAPALKNHTYRWKTKKMIEEAKSFTNAAPTPQELKDLNAEIAALKLKIGESFANEAKWKEGKGDPKHDVAKLWSQAAKNGWKGEAPKAAGKVVGKVSAAVENLKNFVNNGGSLTKFAGDYPGSTSELAKAYGSLKAAAQALGIYVNQSGEPTGSLANAYAKVEKAVKAAGLNPGKSYNNALEVLTPEETKLVQASAHGSVSKLVLSVIESEKALASVKAAKPVAPEALAAAAKKAAAEAPTADDLEKAKKVSPYYPDPVSAQGKAIVAPWNEKWANKPVADPALLAQKVQEYKAVAAQLAAIQQAEAAAKKAAEAAAVAEYAKKKAQAEAEEKAKEAEHKAEVAAIVADLGVSTQQAKTVDALIHVTGKKPSQIVLEFKKFKESGTTHGLPISPFSYAMLQSYVGAGSVNLNEQLRTAKSWDTNTVLVAAAVQTGIKALPVYTKEIYRGIKLSAEDQARYVPGHSVMWKAFSSCGKTSSFSGNTQFVITPKVHFHDLGALNPGEHGGEVLGEAKISVHVVKVEGKPGGNMKIWVEDDAW